MPKPSTIVVAAVFVGCVAALGVSGSAMARRVAEWNQRNDTPEHPGSYHFERNVDWRPEIRAARFKDATLEFEETFVDAGSAEGGGEAVRRPAIVMRWGVSGAEPTRREFPVIAAPARGFKDMSSYEESFAVLTFVPVVQGQRLDNEPERVRLVVVSRRTDYDPATWGAVRVKEWWFEFVELLPGGKLGPVRLMQFPAPRDPQGRAAALIPDPQTGVVSNPAVETIQERSWEWTAALHAVPKGQISRLRFKATAVSAMGWTLPTAGFAILGTLVTGAMLVGGRLGRRAGRAPV